MKDTGKRCISKGLEGSNELCGEDWGMTTYSKYALYTTLFVAFIS